MYISLSIDNKVVLALFYIVYDTQSQRGKSPPYSLMQLLFKTIWNTEDQNIEFDMLEQNPVRFDLIEP